MKTKKSRSFMKSTMFVAIVTAMLTIGSFSCKQATQDNQKITITQFDTVFITENEVLVAQKAWGDGIVKIGQTYLNNGDYKATATEHINNFYNYEDGTVLFKPTLASHQQFRTDFQGALSYFVGGNDNYPEDHGFAIKPWNAVRWENIGTKVNGNVAIAMGNYYFTPAKGGNDVKVEYSFAYIKKNDGKLKIILHDSHLPYTPAEKH